MRQRRAIHPFAVNRESVYRFTRGDTVDVIRLPDRTIPIVRVRVTPHAQPSLPTLLFEGDVDLDATRLHVVRMQGRLIPSGRSESLGSRLMGATFAGVLFIEFEGAEYDEQYWLPREQRFEVHYAIDQAIWIAAQRRLVAESAANVVHGDAATRVPQRLNESAEVEGPRRIAVHHDDWFAGPFV